MPGTTLTSRKAPTGELHEGRVIADFGRHVLIEDATHAVHPCSVKGRDLRVVCGDRVMWRPGPTGSRGRVESLLARHSELRRPDGRGRIDVLVANLDQLIVVSALAPTIDRGLLDRYLAAAAFMQIDAVVVCNKIDIADAATGPDLDLALAEYAAVPYPVVSTSTKTGDGLAALAALADGRTSVLVGQSGVGKSSLLNALSPGAGATIGELSPASGEGTHTTRASRLYRLATGGELIDSPGVREYTPYLARDADIRRGFLEFAEPARDCRFRDCQHLKEPDCGIKAAIQVGQISAQRYASYCALVSGEGRG